MNSRRVFLPFVLATLLAALSGCAGGQEETAEPEPAPEVAVPQGAAPEDAVLAVIAPAAAEDHVGSSATVCGRVMQTWFDPSAPGEPTFLNFGQPYPAEVFSVLIEDGIRGDFDQVPEDLFADREVCVTGEITLVEGKPRIVVDDPASVVLQEEGGGASR